MADRQTATTSLSSEERMEILDLASRYPSRSAAAIDGLLVVQRRRGWVSDEALADLAGLLGMTASELDSIATFYNRIFRKPTGRTVLSICDSISCYLLGADSLRGHLEKRLGIRMGETTPDGLFSLIPNVCLGHCEQAPVMLANREVFGNLTEERIDAILEERGWKRS
ncbi:MAG: NADH-quinone oxidoreductase subunit NuoE [Candidatus Eisenbacteria bacterium]|nr:NADH-quinone oxidoreductase subunit NuoE [Candidatus Eisenbacteria bacterium]